jgi:hypothetical protein
MFFDTTVTSQVYIELFREFVNQLDDQELTFGYYQQDGATSHTSGVSMAEVESFFPDRVTSRELWPSRSPDVTPPDFFLWGYLKGRAYMNKLRTLDELRENIRREIQRFWQPPSETCNVVFSCVLTIREGISSTSCDNRISYRYDMQM